MDKWLVFVGEKVPVTVTAPKSYDPYDPENVERALRSLGFQHIEGSLWVSDVDSEDSAMDLRGEIQRRATTDDFDQGQQRFIIVKFIRGDNGRYSQFDKWLK